MGFRVLNDFEVPIENCVTRVGPNCSASLAILSQCLNIAERKNKGTNKQQQPDSGIHHTSTYCLRVYQVSTF